MGKKPWVRYLWPGLPQIWSDGSWSALALAAAFAVLVNLALLATLVWSELFPPGLRRLAWLLAAVFWGGSAVWSYWRDGRSRSPDDPGRWEDPFREAIDHYLQGNWLETEQALRGLLDANPRDLDAGLMLATLLRGTGRVDEAARQLDRLWRQEGSEKWELEIRRERALLDEARGQGVTQSVETTEARPAEVADAA